MVHTKLRRGRRGQGRFGGASASAGAASERAVRSRGGGAAASRDDVGARGCRPAASVGASSAGERPPLAGERLPLSRVSWVAAFGERSHAGRCPAAHLASAARPVLSRASVASSSDLSAAHTRRRGTLHRALAESCWRHERGAEHPRPKSASPSSSLAGERRAAVLSVDEGAATAARPRAPAAFPDPSRFYYHGHRPA